MLKPAQTVVHHLYGIDLRTPWPVAGAPETTGDRWDVEFVEGEAATFAEAAARIPRSQATWWAQYVALPDGSSYRRWTNLFEFLVAPDARQIYARTLHNTHREALLAYLLVDALSFSMVRLGLEPLHATTVVTSRGTVAFVGPSGVGKSTLAAQLLRRGCWLLTDDMMVLRRDGDAFLAQPGPPRIKLYRNVANQLWGASYTGIAMNADTDKLIIPLSAERVGGAAHPLQTLYIIETDEAGAPPRPEIRLLSPAEAIPRVLTATAAHYPSERDRLIRQFDFVTQLVERMPIKSLSYRRDPDDLVPAGDAVLEDLGQSR